MFVSKIFNLFRKEETTKICDEITNSYNLTMDRIESIVEEKISKGIKTSLNEIIDEKDNLISLQNQIKETKKELIDLTDELEEIKLNKKIEIRDIEHMVKMKEEILNLNMQKKEVELEKKFNSEKMELLEKDHKKVLELLENNKKDMTEIYTKIMDRLPNVNMRIKRED